MIVDFFINLHIDLNVAIEKRKNFDATIDRETISVQNIDFRDVAIDEISEKIINDSIIDFDDEKNDTFFERSRTFSNVKIEKNKNFDDEKSEKNIDRNDEKDENINCFETNFDFDFFV